MGRGQAGVGREGWGGSGEGGLVDVWGGRAWGTNGPVSPMEEVSWEEEVGLGRCSKVSPGPGVSGRTSRHRWEGLGGAGVPGRGRQQLRGVWDEAQTWSSSAGWWPCCRSGEKAV